MKHKKILTCHYRAYSHRGGSRTAETSKMDLFVIIINGFQPLTSIKKRSILDVAAALDRFSESSNKDFSSYKRKTMSYNML